MKALRPNSRSRSKTRGTLAVGSGAVLGITVEIMHMESRIMLGESVSSPTSPAGMPKQIVKTLPLCIGHVPKSLVDAIELGNQLVSFWRKRNTKNRIALRRLVNLCNRLNPTNRRKALEDSFVTLPIRWRLIFHKSAVMPNDPKLSHGHGESGSGSAQPRKEQNDK